MENEIIAQIVKFVVRMFGEGVSVIVSYVFLIKQNGYMILKGEQQGRSDDYFK